MTVVSSPVSIIAKTRAAVLMGSAYVRKALQVKTAVSRHVLKTALEEESV